ncbi:hypothetical protein HK405_015162, partial [Cladochytrium tenue]
MPPSPPRKSATDILLDRSFHLHKIDQQQQSLLPTHSAAAASTTTSASPPSSVLRRSSSSPPLATSTLASLLPRRFPRSSYYARALAARLCCCCGLVARRRSLVALLSAVVLAFLAAYSVVLLHECLLAPLPPSPPSQRQALDLAALDDAALAALLAAADPVVADCVQERRLAAAANEAAAAGDTDADFGGPLLEHPDAVAARMKPGGRLRPDAGAPADHEDGPDDENDDDDGGLGVAYVDEATAAAAAAGFPDLAIAVKTGADVAAARLPLQLQTFLSRARNVLLIGDGPGIRVADFEVLDVYSGTFADAKAALAERAAGAADANAAAVVNQNRRRHFPRRPRPDIAAAAAHANLRLVRRDAEPEPRPEPAPKPAPAPAPAPPPLGGAAPRVVPDESAPGWRRDASKNLPGFRALHAAFPQASWYDPSSLPAKHAFLMIDDDSYVFLDNLHALLHDATAATPLRAMHDAGLPVYSGLRTRFRGCDGVREFGQGPLFAHGGSGILMNKVAMERMLERVDDCIV